MRSLMTWWNPVGMVFESLECFFFRFCNWLDGNKTDYSHFFSGSETSHSRTKKQNSSSVVHPSQQLSHNFWLIVASDLNPAMIDFGDLCSRKTLRQGSEVLLHDRHATNEIWWNYEDQSPCWSWKSQDVVAKKIQLVFAIIHTPRSSTHQDHLGKELQKCTKPCESQKNLPQILLLLYV